MGAGTLGRGWDPRGGHFPSGGRPGGGEGGGLALPPHAGDGPLPPECCSGAKSWRPRRRPGRYSEAQGDVGGFEKTDITGLRLLRIPSGGCAGRKLRILRPQAGTGSTLSRAGGGPDGVAAVVTSEAVRF